MEDMRRMRHSVSMSQTVREKDRKFIRSAKLTSRILLTDTPLNTLIMSGKERYLISVP
jgi:hypothetical protein